MLDFECVKLKDACEMREVATPTRGREHVALTSLRPAGAVALQESGITETDIPAVLERALSVDAGDSTGRRCLGSGSQPPRENDAIQPKLRLRLQGEACVSPHRRALISGLGKDHCGEEPSGIQ